MIAELSYPLIYDWPVTVDAVEREDGSLAFVMRQSIRIVSMAGLVPLATLPGHDPSAIEYLDELLVALVGHRR